MVIQMKNLHHDFASPFPEEDLANNRPVGICRTQDLVRALHASGLSVPVPLQSGVDLKPRQLEKMVGRWLAPGGDGLELDPYRRKVIECLARTCFHYDAPQHPPAAAVHTVLHLLAPGQAIPEAAPFLADAARMLSIAKKGSLAFFLGNRAREIARSVAPGVIAAETNARFYAYASPWMEALTSSVGGLSAAVRELFRQGRIQSALSFGVFWAVYGFAGGQPLGAWRHAVRKMRWLAQQQKLVDVDQAFEFMERAADCLLGDASSPCLNLGKQDAITFPLLPQRTDHPFSTQIGRFFRAGLTLLFNGHDNMGTLLGLQPKTNPVDGTYLQVLLHFFEYFLRLRAYTRVSLDVPGPMRREASRIFDHYRHTPFQHMLMARNMAALMQAEFAKIKGHRNRAKEAYDRAVAVARDLGLFFEGAIAMEAAGTYYHRLGLSRWARHYFMEAHEIYTEWEALGKVQHLERCFPDYFGSRQKAVSFENLTIGTWSTASSPQATVMVDMVKALQSVSETILLKEFLFKVLRAFCETVNVPRGVFLEDRGGAETLPFPLAETTDSGGQVVLQPANCDLPWQFLSRAPVEDHFAFMANGAASLANSDPYFLQSAPLFFGCLPLRHQGKRLGLIYLERKGVDQILTDEQYAILEALAAQSAITFQNARLYTQLEEKVKDRSLELSEAIHQLKKAQRRLAEGEKVAALGRLVAGVAHEANTPLGVAITANSHIRDTTAEILECYRNEDLTEDAFQRYLRQGRDSAHLAAGNMAKASDLVSVFKRLAVDQASNEHRRFEVADYLGRIISNVDRELRDGKIQLDWTCPSHLWMNSFPGAFSRVVTNLLRNVIMHAYPRGEGGSCHLVISTSDEHVSLICADEGQGFDEQTAARVCEPFFTSARSFGAKGLGLHVVYNLVTGPLGGTLTIQSEPGRGTRVTVLLPRETPAPFEAVDI